MRCTFLSFFLFLTTAAYTQISPAQEKSIDSLVSAFSGEQTPGCVLAVQRQGKMVFTKAYGLANLDDAVPINGTSVFPLGSLSEQFTAACVGLLAGEGKIRWKDDIRKYIPELPYFGDTVRIIHLLNHTSGLRDYFGLISLTGGDVNAYFDTDFVLHLLAQSKTLNAKPGTEAIPSASDYLLLGELVKRVSSKTLPEFAKQYLFDPLEMTHTFFNEDCHQVVPARAWGYRKVEAGRFVFCPVTDDAVGDHGVYSCSSDMCKWDENFFTHKIGGEALHKWMLATGTGYPGAGADKAVVPFPGMKRNRQSGSAYGCRTSYYRFPDSGLSVLMLSNRADALTGTTSMEIAALLLAPAVFRQQNAPVRSTLSPKAFQGFAGSFRRSRSGTTVDVLFKDDSLWIKGGQGGMEHVLVPLDRRTFKRKDAPQIELVFSNDVHGKAILEFFNDGNKVIFYRMERAPLSVADMQQFAGNYVCKEFQIRYNLTVENEAGIARLPNGETSEWKPGAKDEINMEEDNLHFFRDANGKVTGFMLDSKGTLGALRFEKN